MSCTRSDCLLSGSERGIELFLSIGMGELFDRLDQFLLWFHPPRVARRASLVCPTKPRRRRIQDPPARRRAPPATAEDAPACRGGCGDLSHLPRAAPPAASFPESSASRTRCRDCALRSSGWLPRPAPGGRPSRRAACGTSRECAAAIAPGGGRHGRARWFRTRACRG